MDALIYVDSGPFRMSTDNGTVYLDRGEDSPIYLGFVGDSDNCPDGLEEHWAVLLDWWEESGRTGRAYEATVHRTYETLSRPNPN